MGIKGKQFDDDAVREEMGEKGWGVLGWSFAASAGLTVSHDNNPTSWHIYPP